MWKSRLFWRLFLGIAGLNGLLALGFLIVAASWQRQQIHDQVALRLEDSARLVAHQVEGLVAGNRTGELQPLLRELSARTGTRMTLVDAEGVVLADSDRDPLQMENHRDRPELRAALDSGQGVAERSSPTLGIPMVYLALRIDRPDGAPLLVRTATTTQAVEQEVAAVRRLLWTLAAATGLLSLCLTYLVTRRISRPAAELVAGAQAISHGDFQHRVALSGGDELEEVAFAFRRMQGELGRRVDTLEENRQRLETVLGSMVEGVVAVDSEERILLANDASRGLLGFVTTDVVGRPLGEVARRRPLHEAVAAVLGGERFRQLEFEVPGEPRRVVMLRATRLPREPNSGVVAVLHDVTELRRLENLRRELVANVSHELKTPLSSIKAYAETLRLGAVNDPAHNLEFVGRIEEQADRLHQLIVDLLSLARVESGQEAFEMADVPLAPLIESRIADYRAAAEARRIELGAEPADRRLEVRADEEGLQTILDNLIDNAIKYTPEGGRVTVRWRPDETMAVLEVIDTGIGIAPENQSRVFERFYRADKARSRELGGTGLGLAIVKHLSQAFGGNVAVHSRPGEGSTFQVRLPLA